MQTRIYSHILASLLSLSAACSPVPTSDSHPAAAIEADSLLTVQVDDIPAEAAAEKDSDGVLEALSGWHAGAEVDSTSVARYGLDRCFGVEEISDSIFSLMDGAEYHEDSPLKRTDLRYIKCLHYDIDGKIHLGEMVSHKAIAQDLCEIFHTLFDERYPIERMVLISRYGGDDEASMRANNTSCHNFRPMTGSAHISLHARGVAVDINPAYNPYVKQRSGKIVKVEPIGSEPYADRSSSHAYKIEKGDACYQAFRRHGFRWGGEWKHSVKDYQHFEKR